MSGHGTTFKNFSNGQSVIAAVTSAAAIDPNSAVRAAKTIGLDIAVYRLIRKLLLLEDQENVPRPVKIEIGELLTEIELHKRVSGSVALRANHIIDTYLKFETKLDQKRKKRINDKLKQRLDLTVLHIRENCECASDLELPLNLSDEDRKATIRALNISLMRIRMLIKRLSSTGASNECD